ncbi:hypothetical protein FACS1894170_03140 [Planctomycetales bacterium]|nr:hypothetical protein FACS1894170_03140 [Planctomycetales bacterium]
MARQFSFGTVFRMTEKPFLKTFFETFGADTAQVPRDKLKRNDIDLLLKLFDDLLPDKRDAAEVVLRHVHALSCEQGVQVLGVAYASEHIRPRCPVLRNGFAHVVAESQKTHRHFI